MSQPSRPNIVLLTIDALRTNHVGCYGYGGQATPQLDRLAASGTIFDQAIAQGPTTIFSFPAIMSSTYPSMLGGWTAMSAERPLLAETLTNAGYVTAAFVSNPYLSPSTGYDRGFKTFDECYPPKPIKRRLMRGMNRLLRPSGAEVQCPPYPSAGKVTSRARSWLARAREPFFLWVHYMDAHWPYNLRRCTLIPHVNRTRRILTPSYARMLLDSPDKATDKEIAALQQAYDSGISYIDRHMGQLLADIRAKRLDNESWIIVTADHGEEFRDHGGFFHLPRLYEELIRVPFIMSFPQSIPAPRRIRRQVQHLDIVPTILDALGLPKGERHQGTSLMPLLANPGAESSTAISEVTASEQWILALRRDGWKLILTLHSETLDPLNAELYDLKTDPEEHNDLAAHEQERLSDMQGELMGAARSIRDQAPGEAAPQTEMDEGVRERLRALGYVD